jgi:hypothetical protein
MVNNEGTLFKTWDKSSMLLKIIKKLFFSIECDL